MTYIELQTQRIDATLLDHFWRRQEVSQCWRKVDGHWRIEDIAFVDDWSEDERAELVASLRSTVLAGGVVFGAFLDGKLKGFSSVAPDLFGKNSEYLDLSNIHVSEDMRGQGIGRELFHLSKEWARAHGARKLYISAHSAVESQAFYRAMGCVEAHEYHPAHVELEPFDCQLECPLL